MTPRNARPQPQVLLMVPTSEGVGLTSASLGLIQALDTVGLKAGFLKPFRQDELNGPGPDRSTALVGSTLGLRPPSPLDQAHLERLVRQDRLDVLMEQVIDLHDQAVEAHEGSRPDLIVVEGLVPTSHGTYATALNAQLAHALNARIILVGSGDMRDPQALAEQLDMHARAFGGVGSTRTLGCILMRMRHLPGAEESPALIPGTASPALDDELLTELRRYSPALATDRFPPDRGGALQPGAGGAAGAGRGPGAGRTLSQRGRGRQPPGALHQPVRTQRRQRPACVPPRQPDRHLGRS